MWFQTLTLASSAPLVLCSALAEVRLARGALTESFGCVQEHTGLRGSMVLVLQETREAAVPGRVTLLPFPHPVKESQSCCEL